MAEVTPSAWWLSYHRDVSGLHQWDGGDGTLGRTVKAAAVRQWEGTYIPRGTPPGVVLLPAQHHTSPDDYARLNADLAEMPRVVLILFGDEASVFDWRQVHHPDIRFWVMTPRRSVHGDMPEGTRFIGEGSGPKVALPPTVKDLDVYFGGQITHNRRRELADVLRPLQSERVVLEETPGFMAGRPRAGYLSMLARAKIAPCPSGAQTTCSFRLFEAIEAGCVPVVERRTPDGKDHSQWEMVYGDWPPLPFPVVDHWDQLPDILPWWLDGWEEHAARCQAWWKGQQQRMVDDLRTDLSWLGATVRP